jgi:hypothetical protein
MPIVFFERRLIDSPEISKELSGGIEFPHDITLSFSNIDGLFTDLWDAGEEFRGKIIKLARYEPNETYSSNILIYEASGIITDFNILPDIAEFTISVQDPDPLQADIPKKVYEIGDWTQSAPLVINPTPDLGKPYPLVFGRAKKVPLRYVHADYTNDYYDYIVGRVGSYPAESNNSNKATTVVVYRSKVIVVNTAYYVHGGEATIQYTDASFGMTATAANPYLGYAFIRFKSLEQLNFQGSLHELHADFRGLKLGVDATATRNFAKVIQYLLSDTTWGLSLSINSASFTTAIAQVTSLYCDGFIAEQIKAQDIINELLDMCYEGYIYTNENGERVIVVDAYNPIAQATFSPSAGRIISINKNKNRSTKETIKNIVLNYRYNEWENTFIQKTDLRSVFAFGEEIKIDARFVRDHETADRITCYKQRLRLYGDHLLEIEVGMEGRFLQRFDPVDIVIPSLEIDDTFQVRDLTRGLTQFPLNLISYSSLTYDYVAGSLPDDENPDDETDYSNTAPDAPTSLTKVSEGTYQSTDGTTYAFYELSAVAPTVNFARILFGYRKQGETLPYTWIPGELSTGQTWKGNVKPLVPGILYQVAAVSENNFGLRSTLVTLNSQTAPGDTTAPAQVTGMSGKGKYKTWHFEWTKNTEADLKGYHVQIGNSGFSTVHFDKVTGGNSVDFTDDARGYGTLYCRVKAVDFTGNESASWSATASATTSQTQTDDVVDDGITTPKRQTINQVSCWMSSYIQPGTGWATTFTHGLGRIPDGYVASGEDEMPCWMVLIDANQIRVAWFNLGAVQLHPNCDFYYW